MPQTITEAQPAVVTESNADTGLFEVQLISPGWGSSGYYSDGVLKEAAKARVFPKGTHMMIDHQTAVEQMDRPEGTIRDLAAVLAEDARWNGSALVAKAKVFSGYRTMLAEMADDIGVSIRATAEVKHGEAEGRKGTLVERLIEGISVDYVTRAGRGGRILSVLEAARATPIIEATSNDRRDQLQRALPPQSWVLDFDEGAALVFFNTYDPAAEKSVAYQQAYEIGPDDRSVALSGDPSEVRIVTQYLPIGQQAASETTPTPQPPADPAGTTTTESSEEMNMAQIDDQELSQLRESAGRVNTLVSERDAATARAEAAEGALAERDLRDDATKRAREATSDLHPATAARVVEAATRDLPRTADGALDGPAFAQRVTAAVEAETSYLQQFSQGRVVGFGASVTIQPGQAAESIAPVDPWGTEALRGI